jgi:hypothetical protein
MSYSDFIYTNENNNTVEDFLNLDYITGDVDDTPNNEEIIFEEEANQKKSNDLDEKLFIIINVINRAKQEIINEIKTIKNQRIRKHRNPNTQCVATNRKNQRCQGYICKKSRHLCYSHQSSVKDNINSHLFKKKKK